MAAARAVSVPPPREGHARAAAAAGGGRRQARSRPLAARAAAAGAPSAAQAVQEAADAAAVLAAADLLPLPGREAKQHLLQHVHQAKRQATAARALARLARLLAAEGSDGAVERGAAVRSSEFEALCACAAAPSVAQPDTEADAAMCADALRALATIASLQPAMDSGALPSGVAAAAAALAARIEPFATCLSGSAATGVAWACGRLGVRVGPAVASAAERFPFDVSVGHLSHLDELDTALLSREIPFSHELLITRTGDAVTERRATCWMADEGVGGLAYSGKMMRPVPFTPAVASVRDAVEAVSGHRFDCALINWYEDGDCACAWHFDPDHGECPPRDKWETTTVVVCVGQTRKFNFRPMPGDGKSSARGGEGNQHTFSVSHGDLVWMRRDCQDAWQHSVSRAESAGGSQEHSEPRISIVFKRAHVLPGGGRGHPINARGSRKQRREGAARGGDLPGGGRAGGRKARGRGGGREGAQGGGRGGGRSGGGRGRGGRGGGPAGARTNARGKRGRSHSKSR